MGLRLQRCEERVRGAKREDGWRGGEAETALGQNTKNEAQTTHGALHPAAWVLLWCAALLGCFPFLLSRETRLLSRDTREQKGRGCVCSPAAHSEQDLRRGAERELLPLSAHCSFCKWFSRITSKINSLSEPTQPGSGLLWQGMELSNFRFQNHRILFF